MNNSIAFAKWFITKYSNSGILVDGNDLQFILSQLDQSSWDEFSAINSAKDTVDTLIPLLVPPMPKRGGTIAITGEQNIEKPVPKKRASKVAKKSEIVAESGAEPVAESEPKVSAEITTEKPAPKKRATKVAKISEIVADTGAEVEAEVEAESGAELGAKVSAEITVKKNVEKSVPKKRASKATK